MTTALSAQNSFLDAADLAYMQVSTGAFDYITAIRAAVKDVASKGLTVINYASGRQDQLDVAMRRAVLAGVSQTAGQLQLQRVQEMGTDLVAVTAHMGARNKGEGPMNHEAWQGAVYSVSGASNKYKPFIETTGYGTGEGLGGWNCRHSFYPWIEGLSTPPEDGSSFVGETVTYNGKKMSLYEATQQQRAIERKIRYWKRQAGALESAGLDNQFELSQVEDYQKEMRGFLKQMNDQLPEPKEGELPLRWYRQPERERVVIPPPEESIDRDLQLAQQGKLFDLQSKETETVYSKPIDLSERYENNQLKAENIIFDEKGKEHVWRIYPDDRDWLLKNQDLILKAIEDPLYIDALPRDSRQRGINIAQVIYIGEKENEFLSLVINFNKRNKAKIWTMFRANRQFLYWEDGKLKDRWMKIK